MLFDMVKEILNNYVLLTPKKNSVTNKGCFSQTKLREGECHKTCHKFIQYHPGKRVGTFGLEIKRCMVFGHSTASGPVRNFS